MKRSHTAFVLSLCAGAAALAGTSTADAGVTAGFDEITGDTFALVGDGYEGFDWEGFSVIERSYVLGSGYDNGAVSPDYVAFNRLGEAAGFSRMDDGLFTFEGAFFTAAWNDDLNITIEGLRDGELVHTQLVIVDTDAPTWVQLDFTEVDEIRLVSTGGVNAGVNPFYEGTHFAMDNISYSLEAVPGPGALALLGLAGLAGRRRRRD